MGSGASAPVAPVENFSTELEKLRLENARLKSRIQQLQAGVDSSPKSLQENNSDELSLEVDALGKGGRRREEISAEVRKIEDITSNYVKRKGTPKSKEILSVLSQAVEQSLLFNSLGRDDKADCVDAFTKQEHGAGCEIFSQGAVGDAFYIVTSGELEIRIRSQNGSIDCKGILKAGQSFGELALLYNKARAATIVTRTPAIIWSLSRDAFVTISAFYKALRTNQNVEYLKRIEAFAALGRTNLVGAAEAMECETHSAGDTIILQGEQGTYFYLIIEGTVRYEQTGKASSADKSTRIIGEDGPGGYFGERALMHDNDKRTASVIAVTTVRLLSMDRSMFRQLVKGHEGELLAIKKESSVREATKVGERFRKNIHLSDLNILRTLGQGAFGRVRLVKHKETEAMYALKYLAKQNIVANASQEHVSNEKMIMMMIDSAFVLKLYNSFQDERYLYFLVELVHGGELFTLLRDKGSIPDKSARFYAAGVVEAFKHMHALCITYRDLKPENLLITRGGYIKLIDLGLAKVVTERTWTLCGTPEYIAPEVIVNMGHDRAVDYWALGILIFEMVAGVCPFEGEDSMATYHLILQGQLSFPSAPSVARACQNMITLFCQKKPQRRIGYLNIADIASHHWFVGFDWKAFHELELPPPFKPKVKDDGDLSNFDKYEEISHSTFPKCSWSPEGFEAAK